MDNYEKIAEQLINEEKKLSPFAKLSSESLGRKKTISSDPFRLEFARDDTRILHSMPFRRLKHKTQVFLSPDNDHICTRMEHVLHVSSIASVIGRCLKLNTDLIHAIAKGHDLGHPPFGHIGEKVLDEMVKKSGDANGFKHEIHGLRVVDMLTEYGNGLNLTYEVRDGIISHCGEIYEKTISVDRNKDLTKLEEIVDRSTYPATLEGSLVRMVDRIAYLGRDLEDGIKAGLVNPEIIPKSIVEGLGKDNGEIIGTFVNDVIMNSIDKDCISLSDTVFSLMNELRKFNYENIYLNDEIERKAEKGRFVLKLLFEKFAEILNVSARGNNSSYVKTITNESPTLSVFFDFIKNKNYTEDTPEYRIVTDYIAGMTDAYAQRSYFQLFLPAPVI